MGWVSSSRVLLFLAQERSLWVRLRNILHIIFHTDYHDFLFSTGISAILLFLPSLTSRWARVIRLLARCLPSITTIIFLLFLLIWGTFLHGWLTIFAVFIIVIFVVWLIGQVDPESDRFLHSEGILDFVLFLDNGLELLDLVALQDAIGFGLLYSLLFSQIEQLFFTCFGSLDLRLACDKYRRFFMLLRSCHDFSLDLFDTTWAELHKFVNLLAILIHSWIFPTGWLRILFARIFLLLACSSLLRLLNQWLGSVAVI